MTRPVLLWDAQQAMSMTSDDAGTIILKTTLPTASNSGPYEARAGTKPQTFHFAPSLAYFALKVLAEYPDELDIGSHRLYYQPPSSPLAYDILRALIPTYNSQTEPGSEFSLSEVDPRLWAVLVQVYNNLPEAFRIYPIPLSDGHLPVLQRIRSTSEFSLVTVLNLEGCRHLTDKTVVALKVLHGLCAMDASSTVLSAYGVRALSRTCSWGEGERRGPWGLRILRLRNCIKVDNSIYACLPTFPLLCAVDLRGTSCVPTASIPKMFRPASNTTLYHPTLLTTSLCILTSSTTNLLSSPDPHPFILYIRSLHHEPTTSLRMPPSVAAQNTYVVLPPIDVKKERGSDNASAQRTSPKHGYYGKRPGGNIIVGNSDVLARRKEKREQLERHEKNKEAWYERNKEVIRECGIDMNRHKDSEMSDFYGRFRPGMKAMDDCEDEDDGDSGDRGGENSGDEDSEDGGDEDDEDRTDSGEDEDENGTDCNGDDDDLQSTGALTELPMNSPPKALSLPPLSAPPLSPGRKWLISESETEGIMTDMDSGPPSSSGFNFGNAILGLSALTPTFDDARALHTRTNVRPHPLVASSPFVAQSLPPTPTRPLALSPMHRNSRTRPSSTNADTTPSLPHTDGPVVSCKRPRPHTLMGSGQIHSNKADHISGSIPTHIEHDSAGMSTYSSTAVCLGDSSAPAEADVELPSDFLKRPRRADAPSVRRYPSESPFSPGAPEAMSRLTDKVSRERVCSTSGGVIAPLSVTPHRISAAADGPSTVRSMTHAVMSSMSSELDLQNAIAKREARELAHRQAAANFYRESSTKIHPLSRHQQLIPPCDYDEHLMLYRDPPPWNNLETTHTDPTTIKSESQRLATNVALPNRGSAKGTEGVKALAEMIKRRKDVQNASCPSQADGGVPNSGKSKGESRNPFRRKGDPVAHSLVTEPGTQKALLTKSVLSLENKTYANVTKPSKRMAAVKPSESFSSLQMPASPEEYQQTAKKLPDQQVPNRGERTDNTGSLLTCLSGSGPPEQVGKIRISAEALSSSTARKTKGDAENSGVFDWKKWCNM